MPQEWKETLCQGRQRDRFGNWFSYGPRHIWRAARNVGKMLARGVPLPCVWEHVGVEANSPDDVKARYAKHTFGHIAGKRVNGRGNLELLHDVPDPKDLDQLRKTRFVSPKVYPGYSDSRGGEYRGTTIAHVAATPTPVQFWQTPFRVLSTDRAVYLSYAEPDMAEETETPAKPDEGEGKGSEIGKLLDALREYGMTIPEEVTDIGGLIIAIKANPAGGDDDLDDDLDAPKDDDLNLDAGAGATQAGGGGAPVLMSMGDRNPAVRQRVAAWARDERKDVLGRIKGLFQSGRIDRPTAKKLQRQAGSVEMSFTADADPVSPLHRKLLDLEKLPANTAWSPTTPKGGRELSDSRAVDRPAALEGDRKAEEDAAVAEQAALAKKYSPKQTAAAAK